MIIIELLWNYVCDSISKFLCEWIVLNQGYILWTSLVGKYAGVFF